MRMGRVVRRLEIHRVSSFPDDDAHTGSALLLGLGPARGIWVNIAF